LEKVKSSDGKFYPSVFISFFFALKARLQVLKMFWCSQSTSALFRSIGPYQVLSR